MGKVMVAGLLLGLAMAGPVAADGKYGVLAKRFLSMTTEQKMLYAAGVLDTVHVIGVRCPDPVASYGETIAETEAAIYKNYELADELWAATLMLGTMSDRGCKRE